MELVTRYYCRFCKGYFMTPDRHRCRKDPANKSCNTCNNLLDRLESDSGLYTCKKGNNLRHDTVWNCKDWEIRVHECWVETEPRIPINEIF